MQITDEMVNAAAKAMWLDAGTGLRGAGEFTWEKTSMHTRRDWRHTAHIALHAAAAVSSRADEPAKEKP